jgi:hypothetical protein
LIADLEGEITGAQFAGEARMIIAGMVNSQTVLLTVAPEQQHCGVQVVEWVGLVASSFQFFTCLAAVFAEDVNRPV